MIVKMAKVTVLCLDADRRQALLELGSLGALHVVPLQPPQGSELSRALEDLDRARSALEALPTPQEAAATAREAAEAVEAVLEVVARQRELEDQLVELAHEERRAAPFGDFDPASARDLRNKGIHVRLYLAPGKEQVQTPEQAVYLELSRSREALAFALVGRGEFSIEAREVPLPERSLGAVREEIDRRRQEKQSLAATLEELAASREAMAGWVRELEAHVAYEQALAGMQGEGRVTGLQGFCPKQDVPRFQQAAARHGWGLVVEEPGPDDAVPTKVENPRWIKPIRAIFEMTGLLPGYSEVDISLPFLIFLSIFFAMLVGDAGYGALFILLTALARLKFRQAPSYPFTLLFIMSGATVVWGLLTGTVFGMDRGWLPHLAWFDSDDNVKRLCFILGALHLSVAHLWNAARYAPDPRALAQLGWIGSTWVMYLTACFFLLNEPFPAWAMPLLGGSVLLILLFSVPPKRLKQEGVALAMLPLDVINNFTDVVSYLRLFAVGTASFAVANAFNAMIAPLFGSVMGSLVGALMLFAGHALNIALCGLGILVHGVRLNTLEFSSHVGMQWTGKPFEPFQGRARRSVSSDDK